MSESNEPRSTADPASSLISPPMRAIAQTRAPQAPDHASRIDAIRAQDADLVAGEFGTIYYKPMTVCGVDLKLEPLQPSIGTVVRHMERLTILDYDESRRMPYYRPWRGGGPGGGARAQ